MAQDGSQHEYWRGAREKRSARNTQLIEKPAKSLPFKAEYHKSVLFDLPVVRVSAAPGRDGVVPFSFALDLDDTISGAMPLVAKTAADKARLEEVTADIRGGRAAGIEWKSSRSALELPFGLKFAYTTESRWQFDFELPEAARCLGLGERMAGINRRGALHTLFNTDNSNHVPSIDSMYKSIPFLIVWYRGRCTGIFLDSPARQKWDLDSGGNQKASIELLSRRGWQLYVIGEGELYQVVAAFTLLTGRTKLPPMWALGHQQSRWSYPDAKTVREISSEFRKRNIPCDTMVLDIDYMDEYRVFTTSDERFPEFNDLMTELADDKFSVVTIIDPGVKKDASYSVYADGKKHEYFCRKADGKPFIAKVWPGDSALPDFVRADVRTWWAALHGTLVDQGVRGIWNDMNEPALFDHQEPLDPKAAELPADGKQLFMQTTPEGEVGHFEVRNLYGFQMSRSSYEGLVALRPDERPFVLCRSGYAGIQRYAAVWLGDNHSWWEHLERSIPMLTSMGISGVPFCGVDIGGFGNDCGAELLARWYATGIFYPLFRNHCALNGRPQEPWTFTPEVEAAVRKFIETRYRLLPYIQALFYEHLRTGAPLMRPMAFHCALDEFAAEIDDQFFFGRDILVAPIVHPGKRWRSIYLPAGKWHPFEGGPSLEGGRLHKIELDLDKVPAFVRDGAILPLADVVQSTVDLPYSPVTFVVYGKEGHGVYFEDDGISHDYLSGAFNAWQLSYRERKFAAVPIWRGIKSTDREHRFSACGQTRDLILGVD